MHNELQSIRPDSVLIHRGDGGGLSGWYGRLRGGEGRGRACVPHVIGFSLGTTGVFND